MSILNITPDSFSDGGTFYTDELQLDCVLRYAEGSISAGSSILDVGGESSRPGASAISVNEELDRVIPVIEALRARFDTLISVDSSTPEVIRESAAAGVRLINDIRSLQRRGAMEAALETSSLLATLLVCDASSFAAHAAATAPGLAWLLLRLSSAFTMPASI